MAGLPTGRPGPPSGPSSGIGIPGQGRAAVADEGLLADVTSPESHTVDAVHPAR